MPRSALENAMPVRHCASCMVSRGSHIAVVGFFRFSWMSLMAQRAEIGILQCSVGHIGLNGVSRRPWPVWAVSWGIFGQVRVHNGDIRCDVEVRQRYLIPFA